MSALVALMFLFLQDAGSIEGVVVKLGSGDAIANARVILSKVGGNLGEGYSTSSGTDGKFVFQNVPPMNVALRGRSRRNSIERRGSMTLQRRP
jgi:hypothetical protein